MAQIPATHKTRRWALSLWARLIGPERLAKTATLQASERAALDLRAQGVPAAPQSPTVTFLIPLVGKHHVNDWSGVSQRLAATLASFTRQDNGNWSAVICGQDAPDLPEALMNDPRITFLPFTTPVDGNDKWAKLRQLCEALPEHVQQDGYVMPFDADDLLAPGQISAILHSKPTGGALVSLGYVADQQNDRIALAGPPTLGKPRRKPFWKLCGSCAALRYRPEDSPAFLTELTQHEHRMFPYLAALAGRPLQPLPTAAALYVLNHGDNFGARRGRVSSKTHFTQRYAITDPQRIAQIRAAFAFEKISPPEAEEFSKNS
ncbi:hypothetical protein [Cognatishimia sp. MH4019]|uniref:hypothetical protein n=1 Tax=Cognatishimia sp. MH4019 TaxID=2854030 RepID=UPI001CD421A8|nr:hypothetical protein [Cognatishimia sp. MH4019]